MKILIDALGIHDYGGGRTATLNLLQNLLALDKRHQYRVLLSKPEPSLLARNVHPIIAPTQNRFLARIWAQWMILRIAQDYDLVHFTKNLGAPQVPAPYIVTLYDLTTLLHPELMSNVDVWYWRWIQPITLKKAARVVAISRTTAQDARTHFGVDAKKMSVIYPSVHARFQPAAPEHIARTRARYNLPAKYLLHVGRIDNKNNISLLVNAFQRLHSSGTAEEIALVIAGGAYAKSPDKDLAQYRRGIVPSNVIFTGRIPDGDLPALYSGAQVVVTTSLHEGFGLAAVEALACGAPLIAGRVGALPEVLGGAALFVDPLDAHHYTEAMRQVVCDHKLRQQLSQRGLERASRYQNQHDARDTLDLYAKIAKNNPA